MKYIRTKDAIGTKTIDISGIKWINVKGVSIEVVKESDTIEELCDAYFIEFEHDGKIERYVMNSFRELKDCFIADHCFRQPIRKKCSYYGAIWVCLSNGSSRLEPVAEMNENGELELL